MKDRGFCTHFLPRSLTLAAFLVLVLLSSVALGQDELTVTVIRQKGKVEVKLADEKAWQLSEPDLVLVPGDMIRTLKGGKVQLLFPGETIVLIKENSLLNLMELSPDGGGKVKAAAGNFLFNIQQALSPGSTFEVESPGALAVVRGSIWAEFIKIDGSLLLVSFDDDTEVTAGGVTVIVMPGYETRVPPGGTPSDPVPTSLKLDEVLSDFSIDVAGESNLATKIAGLLLDLQVLENEVGDSHSEFLLYYEDENKAGMALIFRNVPDFEERLELLEDAITEIMLNNPDVESLFTLDQVEAKIERIREMFEEIYYYINQFVVNPEDFLDKTAGLIPESDPRLGIRGEQIDSDGDGLSDALELRLGLDPSINNLADGFIELTRPEHAEVFSWPADTIIEFSYIPLVSPLVGKYRLWIEGGDIVFSEPLFSDSLSISVEEFLDPAGGGFGALFTDSNEATLTWYVTAEVDQEGLDGGEEAFGRLPSSVFGLLISSIKRTFDLHLATGGTAFIRVDAFPSAVRTDDIVRVEFFVESDAAIKDIRLRLRFDPSVLEFRNGNTEFYWTNSTLFFGETAPGEVTVSGLVNRDVGFVSGSGILAEIEFLVRGDAGSVSPLDLVEAVFFDPGGAEISVLREDTFIEVVP